MKKPVIAALCCLLALGTATAAFAEEPAPPLPQSWWNCRRKISRLSSTRTASRGRRTAGNCLSLSSTAYPTAQPLPI